MKRGRWVGHARGKTMATIEERLQVLEHEHTQLKKTIELQTIAIRALVSKEALEKIQETVEKIQEEIGHIKTSQESLKLDFECQGKRIVHFEEQKHIRAKGLHKLHKSKRPE
jgi:archaellum component FlaC